MIQLRKFIEIKWNWAKRNPLFWLHLLLAFLTYCFVVTWPAPTVDGVPSDFRVRTWAMVLQLIGAYIVWKDLTSTARDFGRGNFIKGTLDWLKAGLFGQSINLFGNASMTTSVSMSAHATQRRPIISSQTIEERVATLEANSRYIDDDIHGAYLGIEKTRRDLGSEIKVESQTRTAALQAINEKLSSALIGNINKLAFGAWWLFAGIVLSSLSQEIAKLAAGQWRVVLRAM